jgi:hypothetical protein
MNNAVTGPSETMISLMSELWRLRPPGPDNILAHPAFEQLRQACCDAYPNVGKMKPGFGLSTALRALGLPCGLPKEAAHLSLPVEEAAKGLDAAMRATSAKRIHLVPLDLADDLPSLAFGPAKLGRQTADELRIHIDEARLKRCYPRQDFDAERFSEFHWLVVEETLALELGPEARALPILFLDFSRDLGQIEPHKGTFPSAVEEALFFLLLVPWECWSTMPEFDWRGFRAPWVFSVDNDIFVHPKAPPSPDTLSWEPQIYDDHYGGTFEVERPVSLHLADQVATELLEWDQSRWAIVEQAKRSILFDPPIVHFLVRAFLAEGIDEFLAHITTIEAALGLRADYQKSYRIAPDRHKKLGSTKKMGGRIAGLLGDRLYADHYEKLYDLRSAFLHGRTMTAISTAERVMARSLARKVVEALVLATQAGHVQSREDFLDDLLDHGAPLL